jgi:two-component system, cell cycle response regulator
MGTKESSTDSIALGTLGDSGRTQSYQALEHKELVRRPFAEVAPLEANVILIAHPDNKLLGTRFRISLGSSLEIGRAPSAEISLPDVLSISRNHARLHFVAGDVELEDLQSTNGTAVNDRPIRGRVVLRSGDRFQVGAVHFKFLHERDPEHAYHEAIYQLVMRDGLTEIFNRRKYEEEVQREMARSLRHKRPLALILFDIDHFKQVNDNYGHLSGDFVLKTLAALARELVRPEQIFARVGGEEFVILSPETDADGGGALAERLRERFAHHEFLYGTAQVPITCSFGVAEVAEKITTPEALYNAADRALYAAKTDGRNRVRVYDGG